MAPVAVNFPTIVDNSETPNLGDALTSLRKNIAPKEERVACTAGTLPKALGKPFFHEEVMAETNPTKVNGTNANKVISYFSMKAC